MDFLPDFGKYAPYIWISYGATILVFLWLTLLTLRQNKKRREHYERR